MSEFYKFGKLNQQEEKASKEDYICLEIDYKSKDYLKSLGGKWNPQGKYWKVLYSNPKINHIKIIYKKAIIIDTKKTIK